MQNLEELIFSGRINETTDIPQSFGDLLGPDAREFLLEKAIQIRGNPVRLLARLEGLPKEPPTSSELRALWEERVFLKGFALSRLSRSSEASTWFGLLPTRFTLKIQIERALQRANRGDILEGESLFRAILQQDGGELDAYSLCTLLGGFSLLLIYKGDFREARRCLEQRKAILKKTDSPILSFGTGLYEIMLCLEENDFERASKLLMRARSDQDRKSVNWFFLLHLQLRLNLARNLLVQAGRVLEELKALTLSLQLPDGVLDFRLEEIEWKLRSQNFTQAATEIAEITRLAEKNGDEFLLFRLSVINAQVLARMGNTSAALSEIQKAISKGEAKGYNPALTWAFFHAAGIAWTAKQEVMVKLFLQRGRRLAFELGLRGREACFSYMADVIQSRHASASVVVGLAKYQEIGPELEYFLDTYRLLEGAGFTVTNGKKHTTVMEPSLRRMFFKEPAVFCFQREGLLVANMGDRKVCSLEFESGSPMLAAYRLFLDAYNTAPGVSLAAVHESRSIHKYRDDLHGPATKMLLSRLRDKIKICRLSVHFDRNRGLYSLRSELPLLLIKTLAVQISPPQNDGRQAELLERIAMEPFVATENLCQEFAVSRQALHPALKKLVALGKIRVVRRGPISGYIFSGKR